MADTKISALPAATTVVAADEFPLNEAGTTKKGTASQIRTYIGQGLTNASTVAVSGAYAADTYLAGSAITTTAGAWQAGTICRWQFDMAKTAAGTAAPSIIVRMGTLGTTGDAAIATLGFAVGTAVSDTGIFDVSVLFRSVGSGTSAVLVAGVVLNHLTAITGLTTTGAGGSAQSIITSAGFNSTTQTIIGLSFNGGASFSGTNTWVWARADKL